MAATQSHKTVGQVVRMRRLVAIGLLPMAMTAGLSACGSSGKKAAAPTTAPGALWAAQARSWLQAHGSDLTAISNAAGSLATAVKSGGASQTEAAISQFVTVVGRADTDLPQNPFGRDMHGILVQYVAALSTLRKGIVQKNQSQIQSGSTELSAAVSQFSSLTARIEQAQ